MLCVLPKCPFFLKLFARFFIPTLQNAVADTILSMRILSRNPLGKISTHSSSMLQVVLLRRRAMAHISLAEISPVRSACFPTNLHNTNLGIRASKLVRIALQRSVPRRLLVRLRRFLPRLTNEKTLPTILFLYERTERSRFSTTGTSFQAMLLC